MKANSGRYILLTLSIFLFSQLTAQHIDSLKNVYESAQDLPTKFKTGEEIVILIADTDADEALNYVKSNLKIAELFPNVFDPIPIHNQLGYIYSTLGKADSAIYWLHKGFEKVNSDSINHIIMLSETIGEVYFETGVYDKALASYFNALELSENKNDQETILKLHSRIANCYIELKYFDKAEEYFRKSIQFFKKQGNKRGLMALYNNMGNLFGYKQEYDSAETYFLKCLELSKEIKHVMGEAYSLVNLGENFRRKGDIKQALEYFKRSEQIFIDYSIDYNLSGIQNNIGSAYLEFGDYKSAEKYLQEALKGAKDKNSYKQLKSIYKDLSILHESKREFKQSLFFYKLSKELEDSLLNDEKTKLIADMRIKYETQQVENKLQNTQNEKLIQDLKLEKQESRILTQNFIILGIVLILILLVLGAVFIFNNYRLKKRAEFNDLEREHFELSLKFLRSQLNPHFIFNALGSIQSLILEENFSNANLYLGKFAVLLRSILENSEGNTISVKDELELSELYLELEQMRHSEKFDFQISIDDAIDTESVFIPPMIFQPFIENAIKHGISNIDKPGLIQIKLILRNKNLICSIKDNGIGYNKAKLNKSTHRKSMGLQLVKDRLSKYKPKGNEQFTVDIHNLSASENGGTEVIINLPYDERF
jgi:tetratricopeptide (TPR) repeat protein